MIFRRYKYIAEFSEMYNFRRCGDKVDFISFMFFVREMLIYILSLLPAFYNPYL